MFRRLLPKLTVSTVYDIDWTALKKLGIKGIITDLDNTLVGAKDPNATPQLLAWLADLKTNGLQIVIVSNNNRARVAAFAEPLNLPFIAIARKPANRAFVQAMKLMQISAPETVMIGDQMLTDVFGGNRLGLHTILVSPISIADESFVTRINRRVERFAIARLKKSGIQDLPRRD